MKHAIRHETMIMAWYPAEATAGIDSDRSMHVHAVLVNCE
jgi:hypothetical protein